MRLKKIINLCMNEASQKCFDELCSKPFIQNYRHCKSRKVKEARRKIIRDFLQLGHTDQIKLIIDDYVYWIARNTHQLLHPNIPDSFYVE